MQRPSDPPTPQGVYRGSFRDHATRFDVFASGPDAPEVIRVFAEDDRDRLVLIISGVQSRNLKSTWGTPWRECDSAWKQWFANRTFGVFYNGGSTADPHRRANGAVRTCDG